MSIARLFKVAIAFLFVPTFVLAQPLADRVPADALLYVGWSGSETMGPAYGASHLKAVLDASALPQFINESIPRLLKKVGASDPEAAEVTGLLSAIGGPVWRHATAVYFGGLDTSDPNGPPTPKVAILCQADGEAAALAAQVKKILANVPAPFEIKVEEQGGLVVIATGNKGWGAAQKPASALPASKTFMAALGQVSAKPVAVTYIDVEGMIALAEPFLAQGPPADIWPKVKSALGLGGIKRAIWAAGFDEKDWVTQAFVEAPAPRTGGLPGMLDSTPLSHEILKTIPQESTFSTAGKLDLAGLVTALRNGASGIDPQTRQGVDDAFAQAKQFLGLDVEKDVLANLGDEWGMFIDPSTSGVGALGISIVNHTKNAAKLEAAMSWLESLANTTIKKENGPDGPTLAFRTAKSGTATLHFISLPFVSPTWCIQDGNLYISLYPQVTAGAAEQVAQKQKSILDNADFQAVQKRLGAPSMSGFAFANLPKTAPAGYGEIIAMSQIYLGMADMFGAQSPAMVLPPLSKVLPHLTPSGSVSWADAQGWHMKSVSPFPGSEALSSGGGALSSMMVGQSAVAISILLPSLNRARETANRVKCGSNMRQIGQACLLYSNENRGKYPPDLGTLFKTEDITVEVFVCPSGHTVVPPPLRDAKVDEKAAWVNEHSDYVYLGAGMNSSMGADVIVCYEKPGAHQGQGMNVLYVDGHVEFQMAAEAMRQIDQQRAKKGGI